METDPLKFVLLTTTYDFVKDRILLTKLVAFASFNFIWIIFFIGVYYQYVEEDKMNVIPSLGFYLSSMHSLTIIVAAKEAVQFIFKIKKIARPLKSEGTKMYRLILGKFKYIKIFHILIIVVMVIGYCGLTFNRKVINMSIIHIVIKNKLYCHAILNFVAKICHWLMFLAQLITLSINIYVTAHISAQFVLLQGFITRKLHKQVNFYDATNQEEVNETLKEFVLFHLNTRGLAKEYSDLVGNNIITLFLPLAFGCGLTVYNLFNDPVHRTTFAVWSVGFTFSVFTCGTMGQMVCNESSKLFDLMYSSPWYDWNMSNRKMFLVILQNITKPSTITFCSLFSLDYTMLVKFSRICYAITNFGLNTALK